MKILTLIGASLVYGAAQAAPQYKATTLQPPAITQQVIGLWASSRASHQFIAGSILYLDNGDVSRAVVWRNDVPEILPPAEPDNQHALCIAAYSDQSVLIRDGYTGKCYWYKDGAFTKIDTLGKGIYVQQANKNRQFALLLNSSTFQDQAALWQNDVIAPLNGIGYRSRAYGILEDGTVLGNAEQPNQFGAACIWKPGSLNPTLLNVPGIGSRIERGTSNGYYFGIRTLEDYSNAPFLYKDGLSTDLVKPQWYGDNPFVIGVDTSGRAIIHTQSSTYGVKDTLWDHGVPYKFTDLILDSEVANNFPTLRSMSEDGTLFGGYLTPDFKYTAVVFTPVPEPASMAILGLGALAVLRRRRGNGGR
ncbi:MAG: PEP-CTERM sorting domain-containing protein [Armatimonadetes bacterium]|nr:PEP-CTERM sorting domain-containing protein [Armatimonadota bacterium]